eukprot:CAMPEP_0115569630 /NCGR_PEP_ID=MMETSP0271-20121206/105289_1 /TAXON_ID=71861 /ORGANISM="Scrippsiella trochoidea, Strain CCMP3099" /LENGTH=120 /DNA_ID=CAMNT_0003004155 /DNA_START=230 /DNA_END=590 /DNA_ORIENTATION=-
MFVTWITIALSTKSACEPPHFCPSLDVCCLSINLSSKHWPQFDPPRGRASEPLTAAAAKPSATPSFTAQGWLSMQLAAMPPSHTLSASGSATVRPCLSHARTGDVTLPLSRHEQLGLQQS